MNERELIAGCLQQRHDCQKLLYDTYSRQMYGVCLRYHKDAYMANEALQRGFINVFESLSKYKGSGTLGGWIRTIIVRRCIDLIKEQKDLKYDDIEKVENHSSDVVVISPSQRHIENSEVIRLLDTLPLGYKTVFSMYVLDGLKHQEIAESLEISITTSRSQLYKARKMILRLIQDQNTEDRKQKSQL